MEVIIRGTPEEIAALVRATQERRIRENFAPIDVIRGAVQKAIGDTAEESQDSLLPSSDTETNTALE